MTIPLRVLQVEHHEDDALLVQHALAQAGYDVYAQRVETAAELRRSLSSAEWDLVIADYAISGLTGAKALAMVREQNSDLPFIFVSSRSGEDTAVAAMKTGANDYIMKTNLSRLSSAVGRELREAAVRQERLIANQRVAYLAYHDSLTDLPNRALFLDRLQQAILRSQHDARGLAVLLIDLDGFKEVNDALGHHAGDIVLQEVAMRLRSALRASDTVARLGGDEFAVLLPSTDVNRAELAARKILHDLQTPCFVESRPLSISASIGIAGAPWHATTGDEVLRHADLAMYLAKNDKTGYAVYRADRDRRAGTRASLASTMRDAIDQRQFFLEYQPIVHIQTSTVLALESLVRWKHPEHGRLMPEDFIRVAEHTGLVHPLTSFVLERTLTEWPITARPDTCGIAVNISPRSLRNELFIGTVREILERFNVTPWSLTFEIAESLVMADPGVASRCLNELHDMGVRLVIDDFGKGFSSISFLKRLPIDDIKIDRSFIMGLADGEDDTLVRCMIDLAHTLGLTVVAEGIENQAVLDQLAELGCDAAQGYHLMKPAPAHETAQWLTAPTRSTTL